MIVIVSTLPQILDKNKKWLAMIYMRFEIAQNTFVGIFTLFLLDEGCHCYKCILNILVLCQWLFWLFFFKMKVLRTEWVKQLCIRLCAFIYYVCTNNTVPSLSITTSLSVILHSQRCFKRSVTLKFKASRFLQTFCKCEWYWTQYQGTCQNYVFMLAYIERVGTVQLLDG